MENLELTEYIDNAKLLFIACPEKSAYLHIDDNRPWWRTRRPFMLIKKGQVKVIELASCIVGLRGFKINPRTLYIRFDGEKEAFPVINHPNCSYK